MSFQFLSNYDLMWEAYIRPPRNVYNPKNLGQYLQKFESQIVIRKDLILYNDQYQKLQCSHFQLVDDNNNLMKTPCVIYLHCNAGNRLEAFPLLKYLAVNKISLFCFDFSGSGNSDGDYITLGKNESQDLQIVLNYLKNEKITQLGLWGRSMGAATAILSANKDVSIKALLVDSAFSNLENLTQELAKKHANLPQFLIKILLIFVKLSIQKRVNQDIFNPKQIDFIKNIQIPIMFVASKEDTFINFQHTQSMLDEYQGLQKNLYIVQGDHNDSRDLNFYKKGAEFFYNQFYCQAVSQRNSIQVKENSFQKYSINQKSNSDVQHLKQLDLNKLEDEKKFQRLQLISKEKNFIDDQEIIQNKQKILIISIQKNKFFQQINKNKYDQLNEIDEIGELQLENFQEDDRIQKQRYQQTKQTSKTKSLFQNSQQTTPNNICTKEYSTISDNYDNQIQFEQKKTDKFLIKVSQQQNSVRDKNSLQQISKEKEIKSISFIQQNHSNSKFRQYTQYKIKSDNKIKKEIIQSEKQNKENRNLPNQKNSQIKINVNSINKKKNTVNIQPKSNNYRKLYL